MRGGEGIGVTAPRAGDDGEGAGGGRRDLEIEAHGRSKRR